MDQPTRDGDTTLYILTNLPPEAASATVVARGYRGRWRLEPAFQILATALTSEIDTLAYPKAALFGFAVAVVTYKPEFGISPHGIARAFTLMSFRVGLGSDKQ